MPLHACPFAHVRGPGTSSSLSGGVRFPSWCSKIFMKEEASFITPKYVRLGMDCLDPHYAGWSCVSSRCFFLLPLCFPSRFMQKLNVDAKCEYAPLRSLLFSQNVRTLPLFLQKCQDSSRHGLLLRRRVATFHNLEAKCEDTPCESSTFPGQ